MPHTTLYYPKWSSVGRETEELMIDKVSYTSEPECSREYHDKRIRNIENGIPVFPCKEKDSNDDSNSSTMETHSSFPRHEYFSDMPKVVWCIIEKYIAKSPPEYHSKEDKEEQCINIPISQSCLTFHIFITEKKSQCVHESIPCWGECETKNMNFEYRHTLDKSI